MIAFPHSEDKAKSTTAMPLTFVRKAIPGVIAGAADLDPAAVLTGTVVGATFGLSVGWVVLLCIPILIAVFGVSARIGHETRLGLIKLVRENFGVRLAIALAGLVVSVNVLMIVADIRAVSEALSIVLQQRATFFPTIVAFTVWYILTLAGYERVNRTLSLLALFLFAYVGAAYLSIGSTIGHVVTGIVVPKLPASTGYVMGIIAVFGSLLTPDVVVWQTGTKRESGASFHDVESRFGCVVAAVVSLSVVIASSTMKIADPSTMTTSQAAQALSALGQLGPVLFALGIIGSGMVALPILVASLCFSISEAADWSYGLSEHPWEAKRFYVLICIVLLIAVVVNYIGINTVRTLYWSQVMAGIVIVPILFFILWISNDRRIMRTTNTRWQNFWLGGAVGGMVIANAIFFWIELWS
ncbi:MAG TPA: divalent metal cation transporter [Clostridia bacterium]|nr:divalent metal cation transporter [Clostridia bacterium]